MRETRRIAAGSLIGALTIGACGDDDGGTFTAEQAPPTTAEDLVHRLYGALAADDAATACALFSPAGQAEFVEGTGMPTCEAAVDAIAQEVVDRKAFAQPTIQIDDPAARELNEWCSMGIHVTLPEGALSDPRTLAAFAYTRQPDNTWQVTAYNTTTCG